MSRDIFSDDGSNITAEACAWIPQLETGKLTAADQEAFREWINRSPRHAAEIRYQAEMSKELNVLAGMAQPIDAAADHHSAAVSRKKPRSSFGFIPAAFAISIAALMFFAATAIYRPVNSSVETALYRTAIGEYREFVLSDGSVVKLNTDSQIEVTFDKDNRRVRLLNGEVFFDVTSNAKRPFWVYTQDQHIRVVGTAFLVSLLDKNFELMVTEGRVELASNSPPANLQQQQQIVTRDSEDQPKLDQLSTEPIALVAGQSIHVSVSKQTTPVQTLSEIEQRRELSWQEGLHEFSDDSLLDVVRELSRYNRMKIEITDPELQELKFGGVFRIGETQLLFDALEAAYGVEVVYLDDNSVHLSRLK